MRKINEVLRLFHMAGVSQNKIAGALGLARSTVQQYISRAREAGLTWPLPEGMCAEQLDALLFPRALPPAETEKVLPDWQHIHHELTRKGVTLRLLWLEYHQAHPEGYGYTRFCQLYRTWAGNKHVVMRFEHKAGEKIFVDFAGPTMEVIDPMTGEVSKAQVFVAALGASSYTFACGVPGQDIASWLSCHVRTFRYFGGVSAILVPDNLKSGVSKACRYDPDVNPAYQELAEHYSVAVIPARAGKARDKAKAEVAVQNVERWIMAPLRGEVKTDFTQAVENAVDQYRFDRNPRPKGQSSAEPLLDFPRGALVHFAVSATRVRMTTKLAGPSTFFLPFDRGNNGAAGNPVNPDGYGTAYLWEQVWERESWLEILGRYIVAIRNPKKQIEKIFFPRFHQLDATRALVRTVLQEGPGQKYLIQHSAGSGKTNSIAWTAHFLADLHDAEHNKLFSSVLVVSDRTVLDGQLQEAIAAFERTTGVVAVIKGEGSSKSGELADALSGDKKIVVCTIQTFPFAMKTVQALAATQGKTFAVIADEAHSSQTGEAAAKLKQVLSAEEVQELADGGEVSTEDLLAAQMAARAREDGIT